MTEKNFRIRGEDIKRLIDHDGGCIATDRVTVDGYPVGYMYREPPHNDADTGWRFMAGDESQEYMDEAHNHGVYAVNTIANYDHDIIPLVDAPIGSAFARNPEHGKLERVESPIDPDECLHPDFPVVTGKFALTRQWSLTLPLQFNHRVEDGSFILWRLGITLYFTAWDNAEDESISDRLESIRKDISPDAIDVDITRSESVSKLSYQLVEEDDEEEDVNALYGFVFVPDGQLQVAVYFDDESDLELARSLFASIVNSKA